MKVLDEKRTAELWKAAKEYVAEAMPATDDTLTLQDNVLSVATPVKGMSKAEFDRMSDEEKNGLIVVTDEETVSGGGCGEIYSTEETRIGTWFDGKPLYRRMYKFNLPSENNAIFPVATLPENVSVKKLHGYIDRDTYVYMFPHAVYREDLKVFIHLCVRKESNDLRVSFYGNGENAKVFHAQPAIAFVEYTKITD